MKIRRVRKSGRIQWRVAYTLEGKELRRFFPTEEKATKYGADLEAQVTSKGTQWLTVGHLDSLDCLSALQRARVGGFRLIDAVGAYEITHKRPEAVPTAMEALGRMMTSKRAQGLKPRSLRCLENTVEQFLAGRGGVRVCEITTEDVERWLGNPEWTAATRRTKRIDVMTFFSFCLSREWIPKNPVTKIPAPILDDKAPGILTVQQCRDLLDATRKHDPRFIGYIALALFCGIRSAEILRLTVAEVDTERRIVTVAGGKAKTRQRRICTIPENAVEWLKLGFDLPAVNWRNRFRAVREKCGLREAWPQNALRHTLATYHYALHRNANLTASELGHSPDMLFRHYRELATKEQGEEFFGIKPTVENTLR